MAIAESIQKAERLQSVRLRDNLIRLMKMNDAKMTHIHRETGVPVTTIQRICKDSSANPTLASLMPIADFFSVSVAQLIGEEPLPGANYQQKATQKWSTVPIISWQQAINWPNITPPDHNQPVIGTEIQVSADTFALEICDDHHDNFQKGSLLIVDPALRVNHRDYVISYKKGSQQVSLKQALLHEGDIYLKPTNPAFKTTLMDENYHIAGVVVQIKMNLK